VTPEAVQLVAGLNSESLPQKSKQRYIGQFFLTKVCNNYSLIHKFLINEYYIIQTSIQCFNLLEFLAVASNVTIQH
jgi:hypothetical protein